MVYSKFYMDWVLKFTQLQYNTQKKYPAIGAPQPTSMKRLKLYSVKQSPSLGN